MKRLYVYIFGFLFIFYGCTQKPVGDDEILNYATKFARGLASGSITDSSFLETFGVANSVELNTLEASSVVPAVFFDLAEMERWKLMDLESALDTSNIDNYQVSYLKKGIPISEWIFKKNNENTNDSTWWKGIFSRVVRVVPVFGERCKGVIYPDVPNTVTLRIDGFRDIVVPYGLDCVLLFINDGEVFHRFHVIDYKNNKYVVPLTNLAGEVLGKRSGIVLSDFQDVITNKKYFWDQNAKISIIKSYGSF